MADNKPNKLRYGFTTGTCAAAAAKAAAYMLLFGRRKEDISLITPKGIAFHTKVENITCSENAVSCTVTKDAGDDPDVTNGTSVGAKVSREIPAPVQAHGDQTRIGQVYIDGGEGVGRVTREGLDQPVGAAAINHVPRQMIAREVSEVMRIAGEDGPLYVEVFLPEGRQLAEKTFNPRLGITGGISILGTSGIVEPMSSQALLDTIHVEMRVHRAAGENMLVISPGNYGQDFLKKTYGYDLERSIKISNFIGASIDMAAELGFERLLYTGHIGKLVKVAGGIMNTHSHEADARLEILTAAAVRQQVPYPILTEIIHSATTDAALDALKADGHFHEVMQDLVDHIQYYMNKRVSHSGSKMQCECMMYSNKYGLLAATDRAEVMLSELTSTQ